MAYIQYGRNILRHVKTIKDPNFLQSSDHVLHHPLLYAGQGVRYRKLEVILTTTIDKLGKAGETVTVAPGYFRNHLMPKLLAVPNIDKFAHLISEQRKIYQPKEVEEVKVVKKTDGDRMKEYQAAAKRLDGAKLVLKQFGNVDNELRSPVSKDELIAEYISLKDNKYNKFVCFAFGSLLLWCEVTGNMYVAKIDLSVNCERIEASKALVSRQLFVQIEPENLQLPSPLSSFGEFEVPLRLPKSIPLPEGKVQWTLNVKIRRK
ncbi:unnamed protein product [Camellia sinensis]